MEELYKRRIAINAPAAAMGGSFFSTIYYWSSTQFSSTNGVDVFFSDGTLGNWGKNTAEMVRAVRKF